MSAETTFDKKSNLGSALQVPSPLWNRLWNRTGCSVAMTSRFLCSQKENEKLFLFLFFDTNEERPFIAKEEVQPAPSHKAGGKEKRGKAKRTRERPRTRPRQAGEHRAKKRKTIQGLASKSCDCTDTGFNTQLQHPACYLSSGK
jgi:hypothetical protein